ncbi:hypothetical protein Tco_1337672 [Tanacetum coccineum]
MMILFQSFFFLLFPGNSCVNKALFMVFVVVSAAGSGVLKDWKMMRMGSVVGVSGVVGSGVTIICAEPLAAGVCVGVAAGSSSATSAFGVKKVTNTVPDSSAINALKFPWLTQYASPLPSATFILHSLHDW